MIHDQDNAPTTTVMVNHDATCPTGRAIVSDSGTVGVVEMDGGRVVHTLLGGLGGFMP